MSASSPEAIQHDITIKISNDYYEAYISIDMQAGAPALTKEQIKEQLTQKNVTFGIKTNIIDEICKNQQSVRDVLIASGVQHQNGEDGVITYHFDTNLESKPTLNEDGSVDFKNMNFLHLAEVNQVLASRTMPTEGKNGTTVTGKNIPGRKGKIVNFKIGKNVRLREDGLSVEAEQRGNIEFNGERLAIINVLEIKGDVGVSTGNIDFSGKVIVNGNVTTGYQVKSDEEIIVNGIVEGALLHAGGDIIINGGIQGHDQADIVAAGNIISKFINNAKVICKKDIEADVIMHSFVECDGQIKLSGKKSLLVGGKIYVRFDIDAKTVGSEMGTITDIQLGITSEVLDALHAAQEQIKTLTDNIKKLSQASAMLKKQYDQTQSKDIKVMLDKTESSRTDYTQQLDSAKAELIGLNDLVESLKGSKVKAENIYPGVRLKISNSYYNVKAPLKNVILRREDGEIRAVSMS